jgi:sulfoxide reductase heme-binding subunit YedZ
VILALAQAPSPLWFFARAAGFVSLILLAGVVSLGLLVSMRWRTPRWPSFLSEDLHRYLGTVLYVFLAIHIVTVLLDPFTRFSIADVAIPFVSSYRPLWMGLGVCAAELTIALGLSVHVRKLIGYRLWRLLHYGTYLTFPVALAHGLGSGSDTHSPWAVAIYMACAITVASLAVLRWQGSSRAAASQGSGPQSVAWNGSEAAAGD